MLERQIEVIRFDSRGNIMANTMKDVLLKVLQA